MYMYMHIYGEYRSKEISFAFPFLKKKDIYLFVCFMWVGGRRAHG